MRYASSASSQRNQEAAGFPVLDIDSLPPDLVRDVVPVFENARAQNSWTIPQLV